MSFRLIDTVKTTYFIFVGGGNRNMVINIKSAPVIVGGCVAYREW